MTETDNVISGGRTEISPSVNEEEQGDKKSISITLDEHIISELDERSDGNRSGLINSILSNWVDSQGKRQSS